MGTAELKAFVDVFGLPAGVLIITAGLLIKYLIEQGKKPDPLQAVYDKLHGFDIRLTRLEERSIRHD